MSRSLLLISDMAWSQVTFCHFPSTSFSGWRSRFSLITFDRAAAPLEQRLPKLTGCSNQGSWLTQTPSCTSAIKPHPTAQLLQIVLICLYSGGLAAADASRKMGFGRRDPATPTPTPTPAVFRNARRSIKGFSLSAKEVRGEPLDRTLRSVIPTPPTCKGSDSTSQPLLSGGRGSDRGPPVSSGPQPFSVPSQGQRRPLLPSGAPSASSSSRLQTLGLPSVRASAHLTFPPLGPAT